jgi:hypothetical protein
MTARRSKGHYRELVTRTLRTQQALTFGGAPLSSNALLGGAGSSAAKETTSQPNKNFFEFRLENTATSGDNRGIYNRLYLAGAGGGGEVMRNFTTVDGVAAGTAHGTHDSLNFANGGSVTGQGIAGRHTLHIPDVAAWPGGTLSPLQAEIWSDGADSDPAAVTALSLIRAINGGHADGIADVDNKAFYATLEGGAIGAGNIMAARTASAVSHGLRFLGPDGNTYYIMLSDTQ